MAKNKSQDRSVSDELIGAYRKDGVVCLRGLIATELIEQLGHAIDRAVATLDDSPAGYDLTRIGDAIAARDLQSLAEDASGQYNVSALAAAMIESQQPLLRDEAPAGPGGTGRFVLDTGVAARIAPVRTFALKGPCPAAAAALLGSRKANFYDDQIFVKEPGTRERTAYHQDGPYFHLTGDQICTFWIPVDAVGPDCALRYVRGSHRWGKRFKPNVFLSQMTFPGSEGETLPDVEGNEEDYDIVSFGTEPGDVIVHHHLTIHGAPGNFAGTRRRAIGIRYCGDDVRYKFNAFAPQQLHHHHALSDGDRLDCDQFPVVWDERSGGCLIAEEASQ